MYCGTQPEIAGWRRTMSRTYGKYQHLYIKYHNPPVEPGIGLTELPTMHRVFHNCASVPIRSVHLYTCCSSYAYVHARARTSVDTPVQARLYAYVSVRPSGRFYMKNTLSRDSNRRPFDPLLPNFSGFFPVFLFTKSRPNSTIKRNSKNKLRGCNPWMKCYC